AALLFVAVAGPWYLVAGTLDPAYLRDFVLEQHLARFFAPTPHLRPQPFGMALLFALIGFMPLDAHAPGRRATAGERDRRRDVVLRVLGSRSHRLLQPIARRSGHLRAAGHASARPADRPLRQRPGSVGSVARAPPGPGRPGGRSGPGAAGARGDSRGRGPVDA